MGYLACPLCECMTLSDVQGLQLKIARSLTRGLSCPICSDEMPGIYSLHKHLAGHIPLANPVAWVPQGRTLSPTETVPALETLALQDASSPVSDSHGLEKTQFNCEYCGLVFSSEHFLNIHQDIIHAQSAHMKLICKICKTKFTKLEDHREHVRSVHGEQRYFCENCPKSFKMKGGLLVHNRMYHDQNAANCKICKKQFSSKVRKEIHEKRDHCRPNTPSPKNPMKTMEPSKKWETEKSSPDFQSLMSYQTSMNSESSDSSFQLLNSFQGPSFQTEPVKDVPAIQPPEKPFEIMFPTISTPFTYQDKVPETNILSTPQISQISQNAFNTNLMNGMNFTLVLPPQNVPEQSLIWKTSGFPVAPSGIPSVSSEPMQFPATMVNPVVAASTSVEAQIVPSEPVEKDCIQKVKSPKKKDDGIKQNDSKQWECDVCKKSFTTKYFLKKHKRLHTGETPYSCDECGKTFTFQQSYHKHIFYHTDEKPHVCTHCGRSFKELSTLQNHVRTHTGEKPFKCPTCGRAFRQRVSYLVHQRIHNGIMPYKCNECGKTFRYKVSMRSHKCEGRSQDLPHVTSSDKTSIPNTRLLSVLEALTANRQDPFEPNQDVFPQGITQGSPNNIPILQNISETETTGITSQINGTVRENVPNAQDLGPTTGILSSNVSLSPNIETDLFLRSLFE